MIMPDHDSDPGGGHHDSDCICQLFGSKSYLHDARNRENIRSLSQLDTRLLDELAQESEQ